MVVSIIATAAVQRHLRYAPEPPRAAAIVFLFISSILQNIENETALTFAQLLSHPAAQLSR